MKIDKFDSEYSFLSNFFRSTFTYRGLNWDTVEHAFQAQKTISAAEYLEIHKSLTPGKAKRLGRKCKCRNDWNHVKLQVMTEIVRAKFVQNPKLAQKLLDTGNTFIEEGNTWKDTYWGTYEGKGQNHLGLILMEIREEIKDAYSDRV